jgi:hypothetical protein
MTLLLRYQRKILISKGILAFQNKVFPRSLSVLIIFLYNNCTEKWPFLLNIHANFSFKDIGTIESTELCRSTNLSHVNAHLNEIFKGVVLSTCETTTPFLLTILYKEGNIFIKGLFPNQQFSQNLVWLSLLTLNLPFV